MENGHFYFIKDEYFEAREEKGLMQNKGINHGRPCYFCYKENDIYWMVPISHRVEKYKAIKDARIAAGKRCDGIQFGYVNGENRAILVQNMCPVTEKYIDEEYRIENNKIPVMLDADTSEVINKVVRKMLSLYRNGIKVTMTDLDFLLDSLK